MGIKERREREKNDRIQAILQATKTLILEKGVNNTAMEDISQLSELSIGSIYWYFRNKEEVVISLLFAGIKFMEDGLDKILYHTSAGRAKLKQVWELFAELLREHPEYFYVFTWVYHPGAMDNISEEVKTQLVERSAENFGKFEKILEAAFPRKISREKLRILTDALWSTFVGIVILENSRKNLHAKSRMTPPYLESVFCLLMDGILGSEQKRD